MTLSSGHFTQAPCLQITQGIHRNALFLCSIAKMLGKHIAHDDMIADGQLCASGQLAYPKTIWGIEPGLLLSKLQQSKPHTWVNGSVGKVADPETEAEA